MPTREKPNLSMDQKLIMVRDDFEGLPGYVVVVFKRLKSGGAKFSQIVTAGERFKTFPFLISQKDYFAVAVNESVLSYSFAVPVSLDDDVSFELPLKFELTFRASDPRLLAELYDQDPLKLVIDIAAMSISRNFKSQNWESVKNPLEELVLEPERPRLNRYAASLGIEIIKLDFDRSSFDLNDDLDSSVRKIKIRRDRESELSYSTRISESVFEKALEMLAEDIRTDQPRAGGYAITKGPSQAPEENLLKDTVVCSVFAPRKVRRSDNFMVQVFAHLEIDEAAVKALASEFDEYAQRLAVKRLNQEVERRSKLVFCISLPGVEIDEPVQELIWRGQSESVQFGVHIPQDFVADQIVGTIYVTQDSVPFGHLKFVLQIVNADAPVAQHNEPQEAENTWKRYQYAFISYASPDRPEVLKRVQMLARLHIDFFQDLLTLEPGDRWERQLYKNIDRCDVFFLFWSSAARDSKWVMKEVRYALDRRRAGKFAAPEIVPVIIEGPPPVAPPDELRDIHFNDVFIYFLN